MTPSFHHLCQRWRPWIPNNRGGLDGLAAVIGLVAQLDEQNDKQTIAKQMALPKGGGPIISELRFRRLLQQQDRNELYPSMIRVLRQLGRRADRHSLANSVFFWGDGIRKDWAYDYYGNLGA
jgi:CRISPR system Cascade subunit CasB